MNKDILKDNKVANSLSGLLNTHGSTVAMICGLISFGCAFYSAFKASREVVEANEQFTQEKKKLAAESLEMPVEREKMKELRTARNIRYILAYRWVAAFGLAGTGLMVLTKVMDGRAIASWAALAATQRDKLEKLAENGKKLIGEEKFKEIEDKAMEDRMLQKFFNNGEPFALQLGKEGGDVFFDAATLTLFQADKDELVEGLEKAKETCARNHKLAALKFYEDCLGIGIDCLREPESINGCWWGPKRPFDYKIVKEDHFGCTWQVIRYDKMPSTAYDAGVPGFGK